MNSHYADDIAAISRCREVVLDLLLHYADGLFVLGPWKRSVSAHVGGTSLAKKPHSDENYCTFSAKNGKKGGRRNSGKGERYAVSSRCPQCQTNATRSTADRIRCQKTESIVWVYTCVRKTELVSVITYRKLLLAQSQPAPRSSSRRPTVF